MVILFYILVKSFAVRCDKTFLDINIAYIKGILISDDTDSLSHVKLKPAPPIAPKPRPWSMVNSEPRSADLSLLSDGSSPANSTGNTPDSGDALDSSESSSIDRRISKENKLRKSGNNSNKYTA